MARPYDMMTSRVQYSQERAVADEWVSSCPVMPPLPAHQVAPHLTFTIVGFAASVASTQLCMTDPAEATGFTAQNVSPHRSAPRR